MSEPLRRLSTEDEMGAALDNSEAVQRKALALAHEGVRAALAALQPFATHAGRNQPGIERAVDDVRASLTEAGSHLLTIVAEHLDHVAPVLDSEITQTVDRAHERKVIALAGAEPDEAA